MDGRLHNLSHDDGGFGVAKRKSLEDEDNGKQSKKLCRHYAMPSAPSWGEYAHVWYRFKVPLFFGRDLLVQKIMGKDGMSAQKFCDQVSCSLDIMDDTNTDYSEILLRSFSQENLHRCQLAMEDRLLCVTPPELKVFLLIGLAGLNNYHDTFGKGMYRTRHPFSQNPTDACYVAANRAGEVSSREKLVVGCAEAQRWWTAQGHNFPSCRIDLYDSRHDHRTARQFPLLVSHVTICAPNYDDLYKCRGDLQRWCWS